MVVQLITVILSATLYLGVSGAYTDLVYTCFANGTISVNNPDNSIYLDIMAVQNEGTSSGVICATADNGAVHTITNCSYDTPITVYFSNRTAAGYNVILGSADNMDVVYEIQCNDIPDAGVNRTLTDALDVTLEVSTQDIVTPSFTVTSAIRTSSATGSPTSFATVGDTLYWTIDVPANYTAKATCDAYSGTTTSGTPSKRLTTGGCSDDADLLGGDFDSTQSINGGLDTRYYVVLYAFKFYNSDDVFLYCVVTVCPTGSSTCDVTGCTKKKRSVEEEELGPDDKQFLTGSILHLTDNSAASIAAKCVCDGNYSGTSPPTSPNGSNILDSAGTLWLLVAASMAFIQS